MKKFILIICLLLITPLFISCKSGCGKDNYKFLTFNYNNYLHTNSYVTVEFNKREKSPRKVVKEINSSIDELLKQIEHDFSNFSDSTVEKINKSAGKYTSDGNLIMTKVNDDFIHLLKLAIDFSSDTNAFNIAIGSLTSLWDISNQAEYCEIDHSCKIPTKEEIESSLKKTSYDSVVIDDKTKSVGIKDEGVKLDFGAIAKGFACDKIKTFLISLGYKFFVINLGGNVYVNGSSMIYREKGEEVTVGLENPFDVTDEVLKLTVFDSSIVTSSISHRFIMVNGKKYSHIISPLTGSPVENNLAQVTIIGEESAISDALSTTCFILGLDKGIKYLENSGYKGIFITKDHKIYIIGNINYQLLNSNFQIIERK